MKALTCEMCGSTNLIKNEGVFVCQHCGTKYSVEEAKKMMVEGTVSVEGTVKVDTTDELKNLYEIARRAKDTDNVENAAKYYDQILVKDPNSWEANFYVVYYKAMSCKIAGITNAAISVYKSFPSVLKLVNQNIKDPNEQKIVIKEIYLRSAIIARMLYEASKDFYLDTDIEIRNNYASEHISRGLNSAVILQLLSVAIKCEFRDMYDEIRVDALTNSIDIYSSTLLDVKNMVADDDLNIFKEDLDLIRKFKPDFNLPITGPSASSSGCYIATAVYGSYDCPEVWTLRRFRDYTLAETAFGRAFIKVYYATSPTLVRWFGKSALFNKMCRTPLDKLVATLNTKGVQNTPYSDRNR